MYWGAKMLSAVLSHIGHVRKQNQDRYLVDDTRGLFVLCDGMGGHKAGEVAAQMAVDTFTGSFTLLESESHHMALTRTIQEANRSIFSKGHESEEYLDMGTTITACLVDGETLYVASIGDSPMFILNNSGIEKVTVDHTLAQKLYQEGFLEESEVNTNKYRHVLTRALGIEELVEVDCRTRILNQDDYVLISTDGLTDLVEPLEIWDVVINEPNLNTALERLLSYALDRGGHDNVTMILISPNQ